MPQSYTFQEADGPVVTVGVDDGHLFVQSGDEDEARLPLDEVVRVRLSTELLDGEREAYECAIFDREAWAPFPIVRNVPPQDGAPYAAFVRALHQGLKAAGADVVFEFERHRIGAKGEAMRNVAMAGMGAAAIVPTLGAQVELMAGAAAAYGGWLYWTYRRKAANLWAPLGTTYDPRAIPEALLPRARRS